MNENGYWEPSRFNTSLYDILMWGFTNYDKQQIFRHLDAIREALIVLMAEDQDFIDSIELSTSSARMVHLRFDKWRTVLSQVVGSPAREPRTFSFQLKQDLFDQNPVCAICGNRIHHIDDAAVDHIEQYWLGGRTVAENARLVHRFCNWSRPRKEQ